MHGSLQEKGAVTIFSDNYKYMKLIARTVASARGEATKASLLGNEVPNSSRQPDLSSITTIGHNTIPGISL
jgi:hypothetical protein